MLSVPVRGHNARKGRTATLECGARKACSRFAGVRFISAFQSHVSFILGFAWHQEQASCPEELLFLATRTGKLPGGATFLSYKNRQAARRVVSTAPPACGWLRGTSRTSPGPPRRWRRPVRLQGTSARGRGSAAYLPGCARQPLQRPRCGLRQGGLRSLRSASSLPFLVTCQRQVIPSHSFAALAALIVRRVSAIATLYLCAA